jgi:hypothetical protein
LNIETGCPTLIWPAHVPDSWFSSVEGCTAAVVVVGVVVVAVVVVAVPAAGTPFGCSVQPPSSTIPRVAISIFIRG